MLQKIRKTTDSIIFRFFLGIVVLSFAIWGVSDVIKGVYNSDIVTFKNIAPITYQEFDIARSNEIKQMQHHQGVSLSEDQLDQMNISENVLQKLVQAKLMNYLTNEYELNFSDEVIAEVIRGFPFLKNADGIFDIERLKSYLHANNMGIEQYSNEIRNYLSNNLILSSFIGNSYIPKARITNIIDHMSERRVVDIAHLSLKPTKLPDIEATEEQLKNFYNEKKDTFKTPWLRDISYIIVNNKSPKAPSSPSEAEINKFYNENKEEFGKKKLGLVKNDIQLRIKKQKFDLWITEMSKILEDEVAGGSSLKEIADKYSFSIISEKNVTEQNIERKAGGIFSMFSSVIFDMNEKEVSYPADFQNEGIILFEVSKYLPEKIQEFESVKKDVLDKYKAFAHQQETLKRLQDFAQNTDKALFIKEAELLGMSVQNAKSFSRAEMSSIPNLSPEILVSIFSSPTNTIKGPIISNGKAYMFMVTKAYKDTAIGKNLTNAKDDITSKIREGLMEELLFYAQNKSKMKVKIAPNLLKMSKGGE